MEWRRALYDDGGWGQIESEWRGGRRGGVHGVTHSVRTQQLSSAGCYCERMAMHACHGRI
jgi:hypothetical protein